MITLFLTRNIPIALLSILIVFVEKAEAYIDPGTGSMILQAIIAAIAGSAVAIKIFWKRIKYFYLRIIGKVKESE